MPEIVYLVAEFRFIGEHEKTMCKILRNKELLLILCSKQHAEPFSEGLRARTQIHCNIKYRSVYNTYQLRLRILNLEMKAAEHTLL